MMRWPEKWHVGAARAPGRCKEGVGQAQTDPQRKEARSDGEGETSPCAALFPVAEGVLVAEKASTEFPHGRGSMNRVRRSSSRRKEQDGVRGGASHRR
jgi:hypothetical protein